MKKQVLSGLLILSMVASMAQRVNVPQSMRNKALPKTKAITEIMNFDHQTLVSNPAPAGPEFAEEAVIGITRYDLQTNASLRNRLHRFDDGTFGAVYTFGMDDSGFPDRGTGYNYFDGSSWGPISTNRLEIYRAGWPAYAPFGENGEINVAHYSGAPVEGLAFSYRTNKGTGDWSLFDFAGPDGFEGILWPRMATGGVDHSVIHLIALTQPVNIGGATYQGVDGALLYSRSCDGGVTWDTENQLLDEINADNYLFTKGETYEIEAQGNHVAFLFGGGFQDLCLMKSIDNGDSWEKTVIWECPYPLWDPAMMYPTDTFYNADGAHDLDFGPDGKIHVVFGIDRTYSDGEGTFWFPLVDGVGYWNEDRPTFSGNINALNPYGDPESELLENYSLIGWAQDINNNGEWDILGDVGAYYLGASSMPSIYVDNYDQVFVVFSSVTETFNNATQDYRHIWFRASYYEGESWGPFCDVTNDTIHIFDECVFPSLASVIDDHAYLSYMYDPEPGLAVRGDIDPYVDNTISFMDYLYIPLGITEQAAITAEDVMQNQPNPFNGTTEVKVTVHHETSLFLEVNNLTGQRVFQQNAGTVAPGMQKLEIDGSLLNKGIYFYTVHAGQNSVTRKMIVQ